MDDHELERRIDALYELPPERFVAERDRLAQELSGPAKRRVKALAKPTVTAHLLNQLYRRHRQDFAALFSAGDDLVAAQAKVVKGMGRHGLAEAVAAERAAVDRLLDDAAALPEQSGHSPSAPIRDRLATSLRTLARIPTARAGFDGRLTRELGPTGLEALVAGDEGAAGATVARPPHHQTADAPGAAADVAQAEARALAEESARRAEKERREAIATQGRKVQERARALRELERELGQAEHREREMKESVALAQGALARAEAELAEASRSAARSRLEVERARIEADAAAEKLAELERSASPRR